MGLAIAPLTMPEAVPKSSFHRRMESSVIISDGSSVIIKPAAIHTRPYGRMMVAMNLSPASRPRHARKRLRPMPRSMRLALRVV